MFPALILTFICAHSPVRGMIFSFIPGGDAVKNVVTPFLNSFNTTDANGMPTYAANVVRVIDPILAVQFAQNDLVSSPEDDHKLPYPYYLASQNSLQPDQVSDARSISSFLDRGFDFINPWSGRQQFQLIPSSLRDLFGFNNLDRPRRPPSEMRRDDQSFFPRDYYLNDYVYPIDEYPVIERYPPRRTYLSKYEPFSQDSSQLNGDMISTAPNPLLSRNIENNPQRLSYRPKYDPSVRESISPNFGYGNAVSDVPLQFDNRPIEERTFNAAQYSKYDPLVLDHYGSKFAFDDSTFHTQTPELYGHLPSLAYRSRYGPFVRDYDGNDDLLRTEDKFTNKEPEKYALNQMYPIKMDPLPSSNVNTNLRYNKIPSSPTNRVKNPKIERDRFHQIYRPKYDLPNPLVSDRLSGWIYKSDNQGIVRDPLKQYVGSNLGLEGEVSSPNNRFEGPEIEKYPLRQWTDGSNFGFEDRLFNRNGMFDHPEMEMYPHRQWVENSDFGFSPNNMFNNPDMESNPLRHWLEGPYVLSKTQRPKYNPFSTYIDRSNVRVSDKLSSLPNNLEGVLTQFPLLASSKLSFKSPNINYGIVEPNYGNYPIYSFDNTNPVQTFNHQTNPSFHSVVPPDQIPNKIPSIWSPVQKPTVIVSPILPKDHPKSTFTPIDNLNPDRYTAEEVKYLEDLIKTPEETTTEAPIKSDFNEYGVRTNWPMDPKTQQGGGFDSPEKINLPPTSQKERASQVQALVMIPSSQIPQDLDNAALNTIMSTKTYNLLPIQLPESFLNNLISKGLFSMLFPAGDDSATKSVAPHSFSLLNPRNHKVEMYNPTLRGFHGGINPFTHHLKGVGYMSNQRS